MKRRSYLSAMLVGLAGLKFATAQTSAKPIVLYCDLEVAPDKEQEMLHNYHTIFRPAAVKYPGYIDLKILKLRSTLSGTAPAGINYRFQLTYVSEEARQKWIHSDIHKKVWPTIENLLSNKTTYQTLLFDEV
jgi:antibiotic biosynthesis monooxygenase (ABM) superfamily enzyme